MPCVGAFAVSAIFFLSVGSFDPVSATSAFTSRSHKARCCVTRALLSAALARASAAVAGASKPACVTSAISRAVSARDPASACATCRSFRQARRLKYRLATSAATETRASCQSASVPSNRWLSASTLARFCPNRSSSQLVCRASWLKFEMGGTARLIGADRLRPRLALASKMGSSAASDVARLACACAMLERAVITDGLTACAASISSTSKGSCCCCHHCDKLVRLPLCGRLLVALSAGVPVSALAGGSGAYHCGGMSAATVKGGAFAAQPAITSPPIRTLTRKPIRRSATARQSATAWRVKVAARCCRKARCGFFMGRPCRPCWRVAAVPVFCCQAEVRWAGGDLPQAPPWLARSSPNALPTRRRPGVSPAIAVL